MLVEDDGLTLPGGQVDILHKQGHLVVLIQAGPHLTGQGLSVRGGDRHPAGLPLKGRERFGILLVGVDEAALPSQGGVVLIEVAVAAGGVTVGGFQDGQAEGAVLVHHAGDAGGIVGAVGLIAPGAQGVDVALARQQAVPDGVGLVPVGDHRHLPHPAHRVVDDKGGVHHLALVIGPGADTVPGGLKDAVTAVPAAAHDEVDDDRLLAIGGAAQDDATAGVGVSLQEFIYIKNFHGDPPCCPHLWMMGETCDTM